MMNVVEDGRGMDRYSRLCPIKAPGPEARRGRLLGLNRSSLLGVFHPGCHTQKVSDLHAAARFVTLSAPTYQDSRFTVETRHAGGTAATAGRAGCHQRTSSAPSPRAGT